MDIRYHSSRNNDVSFSASEAILKGLADDGGPDKIPALEKSPEELKRWITRA